MSESCAEQHRVGCALGGYYTALAIGGVLPVLHCGPGCQEQLQNVLAVVNGGQNAWPFHEMILPCTSFCESDVVFGGEEQLRKTVSYALESYKADALIIVGGCVSAIVGDDIADVARGFGGADTPVLFAELPGFKGNNLYGHGEVLHAILDHFAPSPGEVVPRMANVLGIVPFYDPFWEGTLENLSETLKAVGLTPNILYGRESGIENFKNVPRAEFNIVLSPWVDLDIAELLERRCGTPFFHYPAVPVGPAETKRFLRELAAYAKLDGGLVERYAADREDRYYYYINRSLSWIHECRNATREFVVISSAAAALSFSRFLIGDLGLVPLKIYIVEDVPSLYQSIVEEYFRDVDYDGPIEVVFTDDGGLAASELTRDNLPGRPLILGSAWDYVLAQNLSLPYIPISAPLGDYPIGAKNYFGYDGGISLFCEYYAACDKT